MQKKVVSGIDDQWDADLIDFSRSSKFNKGVSFVLVVIDVVSRYPWLKPLKTKTGSEVGKAFQEILSDGRQPKYILEQTKGRSLAIKLSRLFSQGMTSCTHPVPLLVEPSRYTNRAHLGLNVKILDDA